MVRHPQRTWARLSFKARPRLALRHALRSDRGGLRRGPRGPPRALPGEDWGCVSKFKAGPARLGARSRAGRVRVLGERLGGALLLSRRPQRRSPWLLPGAARRGAARGGRREGTRREGGAGSSPLAPRSPSRRTAAPRLQALRLAPGPLSHARRLARPAPAAAPRTTRPQLPCSARPG